MINILFRNNKHKRISEYIFLFITIELNLYSYHIILCQDDLNNSVEKIFSMEPQCKGITLTYYISANLSKYMENLSQNYSMIENKPIFSSIKDITNIGYVKNTIYENFTENLIVANNISFDSYDEMIQSLNFGSIDAFITTKIFADIIKMNYADLTYFEYKDSNSDKIIQYKYFLKSSNNALQ